MFIAMDSNLGADIENTDFIESIYNVGASLFFGYGRNGTGRQIRVYNSVAEATEVVFQIRDKLECGATMYKLPQAGFLDELLMSKCELDVGTGILTLKKDSSSKNLYDGEWDVTKGMRLTVTRKKGDSIHVVIPCKLEKNAKLHHFTNANGIDMSAIYTENEDGEFWVEEVSCMLADEGRMIAWWNELHKKKN